MKLSLMAKVFLVPSCCILLTQPLHAEVKINGFGTVVAAKTTDRNDTIYGYSNDISFKPDSRFAVQISSDLGERLRATVQMIARGSSDYNAEFEWAYIQYSIDDNNSVNAGRIRIPFYKHSEYIDAGFAYPWLRVPQNVYNSDFNSWDGISYSNTHMLGSLEGRVQFQYGRLIDSNLKTSSGTEIDIDFKGYVFEYGLEIGNWDARIGYLSSEINVVSPLNNFVTAAVNGIESKTGITVPKNYISNLLLDGDRLDFISGSFMYDNGVIFSGIEAISAKYKDMTLNPDKKASYILAGMRNNKWTYHMTYGMTENSRRTHEELAKNLGLQASLSDLLKTSLTDRFTASGALAGEDSKFYILGVNYNFHSSAVIKFDYTSFDNSIKNSIADSNILSIGFDFIF